jgi:hypothetical protein
MNREAKQSGIDATFWGTPRGVLITEDSPGSAKLAMSMKSFIDFGRYDWRFVVDPDRSLTEHSSRDPKVIEIIGAAASENTRRAHEPEMLGASILKRQEQERYRENCAAYVVKLNGLLTDPERRVWLLTWQSYSFGHALHRQSPSHWWSLACLSGIIRG